MKDDPLSSAAGMIPRAILEEIATVAATAAISANASASEASRQKTTLQTDYQATIDVIKLLTDIRFRCLVFVTAVIAVANALLPGTGETSTRIALAAVGFVTTLGITVYELRNSQLYEVATHRAKQIEASWGMMGVDGRDAGGLFTDRPDYMSKADWKEWNTLSAADKRKRKEEGTVPRMSFLWVPVKHDRGLALIYGGVLGGWVFLLASGVVSLPAPQWLWSPLSVRSIRIIAMVIGFVAFVVSSTAIVRHDRTRYKGGIVSTDL